ncbi:uncharacterized protein LOC127566252 [Drosophila albomicans]|uniref:Uncharacterized protein LOC127566252 n=1 Tax=Drosophila albomicans TaxID=7291 RepID=A0A9C6WEB1_DROAB|nr:uncharacterized protein LOC127566252 [Drosophila albomicans]
MQDLCDTSSQAPVAADGRSPNCLVDFLATVTKTGVDFTGFFDVKSYVGRGCNITKGYVCVFVCFSTKAIHLEATTDLTAEKFLEAFTGSWHGVGALFTCTLTTGKRSSEPPSSILSKDLAEGTRNLILTNTAIKVLHSISTHLVPLTWGVSGKQASRVSRRISTKWFPPLSNEELSTLLAKTAECLNWRPLSPMSEDVSDLVALSLGHFLIGGPLVSMAEPESREDVESIRNRWQRLKALHQHFCVRWKNEYLKELHKRNKWQSPSRDLQIGDMVIIREENIHHKNGALVVC